MAVPARGAFLGVSTTWLLAVAVSWVVSSNSVGRLESWPPSLLACRLLAREQLPHHLQGPIEGRLAAGEARAYDLALPKGTFLAVEVAQRGVDLMVGIADSSGRVLLTVDSPNGRYGRERLPFVAGETGTYRLLLWPLLRVGAGRYEVRVVELRPARDSDAILIEAAHLAAEAEATSQRGEARAAEEAAVKFRRVAALRHRVGARFEEALALRRLAQLELAGGNPASALALLDEALALSPAETERQQLASLRNARGQALYRLGRLDEARSAYEQAIQTAVEGGYIAEESAAWNNLATVLQEGGHLGQALDAYERALQGWRHLGESSSQASVLHNLGTVYLELNRLPEARDRLLEALELKHRFNLTDTIALTQTLLGQTSAWQGAFEAAEGRYAEAMAQARGTRDAWAEAVVLDKMGSLRTEQKAFPAAEHFYLRSAKLFESLNAAYQLAWVRANLGWARSLAGHPSESERAYADAWPVFVAQNDRTGQAFVLYGRARNARAAGDLESARQALESALDRIESLRKDAPTSSFRTAFSATRQSYYDAAIDLLMELHRQEPAGPWAPRALEVNERSRARSFLESLGRARFVEREDARRELLERDDSLLARLDALDRQRLAGVVAGGVEEQQRRLSVERQELLARFAEHEGSGEEPPPVLSLPEIRRLLDPGSRLLAFHLGEERSFAWLVGRETLQVQTLPPRRELDPLVRSAHDLLSTGSAASVQGKLVLDHLAKELLGWIPHAALQGRLLVVADGALEILPLAALPAAGRGEPLVRQVEVVSLDSASVAAALRDRFRSRPKPPLELAVVAGPVYAATDVKPAALRPGAPPEVLSASADLSAEPFPPLPWAEEEARAILRLVPPDRSFAALGPDATRELALSGELARFRVVHFATHAFLHPEHPELSGLALSLKDRAGRPVDGFLRSHQIHRLSLNADLVVLSACRTGLGKEVPGEGILGLTRAFAEAGARSLVASSWSVGDRATSVLMRHFYEAMYREGLPPSTALRRAQLAMLDDPEWHDPRHWAGLVFRGDWR